VLQGIIDSYPKGKKIYPTIPRGESDPFPIEALIPPKDKIAVESYVDQIETYVQSQQINIEYEEKFETLEQDNTEFIVRTE